MNVKDSQNKVEKVLILGYSEAGKTSAAGYISDIIGGKIANTSDYIIKDYSAAHGVSEEWVLANKGSIRKELFDFAREKQAADLTYPAQLAFDDGATIITGMRNADEFEAKRPMFDICIWIDRPGYGPGETDKLDSSYADYTISATNLDELKARIEDLFSKIN